ATPPSKSSGTVAVTRPAGRAGTDRPQARDDPRSKAAIQGLCQTSLTGNIFTDRHFAHGLARNGQIAGRLRGDHAQSRGNLPESVQSALWHADNTRAGTRFNPASAG